MLTPPNFPSLSLFQKQCLFSRMLPALLSYIHSQGYECTVGDVFRDPRVHGPIGTKLGYGHARSAHKNKLAVDINLFRDGKFLTATSDHEPIGIWWEQQGGSWGGRFNDGNHYSLEHAGVK